MPKEERGRRACREKDRASLETEAERKAGGGRTERVMQEEGDSDSLGEKRVAVVGQPWLATRCPPSHSITPPPSTGWGRKYDEKLLCTNKDREIIY